MPQETLLALLRAFKALHSTLGAAFDVADAARLAAVLRGVVTYPYDDVLLRDTETPTPLQTMVLGLIVRMDPTLVLPPTLAYLRGEPAPPPAPTPAADADGATPPSESEAPAAVVPAGEPSAPARALVLTELCDYIQLPFGDPGASSTAAGAPAGAAAPAGGSRTGSSSGSTATYIAASLRAMDLSLAVLSLSTGLPTLYEDGVVDRLYTVRSAACLWGGAMLRCS
jgi:hypothetical protein